MLDIRQVRYELQRYHIIGKVELTPVDRENYQINISLASITFERRYEPEIIYMITDRGETTFSHDKAKALRVRLWEINRNYLIDPEKDPRPHGWDKD